MSKQSTQTQTTTKQQLREKRSGSKLIRGTGCEGSIVRTWCENVGSYGAYGVVIRAEYVELTDPNTTGQCFTGYQYTIARCNLEGTINGGVVMMSGEDFITMTGRRFYDTEIPFDDDIPF